MEIVVAESAGFCFGVKRAMKLVQRVAQRGAKDVFTLGPIIHNPQVVGELEQKGVVAKGSIGEIERGTVIIRAHGITREEMAVAKERDLEVVDATCPYVTRIHKLAEEMTAEGYNMLVVGDRGHPETRGILSHSRGEQFILVIENESEANALPAIEKAAVVAQTTQSSEVFTKVVNILLKKTLELRVFNTICDATTVRQREALGIAKMVDSMVVVGGYHSANTGRLTQICRQIQPNTHQVEREDELKEEWFRDAQVVGVTAGASTPGDVLERVVDRIASFSSQMVA